MSNDLSRYKISKNPIGQGSYSLVYRAISPDGSVVAIKQIILSKLPQHLLDKCARELDISMSLEHRNIVKYYEFFKTPRF